MKKEVLQLWIDALSSDDYTYIRGRLHTKDGFCPLGVLCDLSNLDKWKETENGFEYLGHDKRLPKEVCDWAGLGDEERRLMPDIVMTMNDQGISIKFIIEHLKRSYKSKGENE